MSERAVLRELLRGADPVCLDCREPIPRGAARVAVGGQPWPAQVFWRCGDCEYARERMRAAMRDDLADASYDHETISG